MLARATRGMPDDVSSIIGADSTMRSNQRRLRKAARSRMHAPIEWPSAKNGGGQSGSTTSFMKVSRSISYSEKSRDIPLALVAQPMLRQALPAPVHGGDGEAALARVVDHLEVFLDELGAAVEQAQRALASGRRREARKAKLDPVGGPDGSGDRALRDRIRRDRD